MSERTINERIADARAALNHWLYHRALRLMGRLFGSLIVQVRVEGTVTFSPLDPAKPMLVHNLKAVGCKHDHHHVFLDWSAMPPNLSPAERQAWTEAHSTPQPWPKMPDTEFTRPGASEEPA